MNSKKDRGFIYRVEGVWYLELLGDGRNYTVSWDFKTLKEARAYARELGIIAKRDPNCDS